MIDQARCCVVILSFCVLSCGGSGTIEMILETDSDLRTSADVSIVNDLRSEDPDLDVLSEFEVLDLWFAESVDLPESPDLVPESGEPGSPCETGADCFSGFCVATTDGGQCTLQCEEECPFGWKCLLHEASLPDQIFLCVPSFLALCKPCSTNSDCTVNGVQTADACIPWGAAGSYCGGSCGPEVSCPAGYECAEAVDVSGGSTMQCLPTSGECTCEKWFVDSGAATSCYLENEWGQCAGQRICTADGLSPCDAPEPAAEECNATDDDCDGSVDEEAGGAECTNENEHGVCTGLEECANGQLSCDADEPLPEACDGQDNNCDGQSDEGYPDTDGDGTPDCLETDKDGDGIGDNLDNCEFVQNPEQADFDLDTVGDACDPDDDNDLSADEEDCAPFEPAVYPEAPELCNGVDDNCDLAVDEGYPDGDADGLKDCVDPDLDGDGIPNGLDNCGELFNPQQLDADSDGLGDSCDSDLDGDGLSNGLDNCPGISNPGQEDLDLDGMGNVCDPDDDGDGTADQDDNCPMTVNPDQADSDLDGKGDACEDDLDGDTVPDNQDNCPVVFNAGQEDLDGDGDGNACDDDDDGDGLSDVVDNCPMVANEGQQDNDVDGLGDPCDLDDDGDGDPDGADCAPFDDQVHHGAEELCNGKDDNCNLVLDEGFPDTDKDGYKDCVDADDDGDGDPDETDCKPLDAAIHAQAPELCNGVDDNCSGQVDEGFSTLLCGQGICQHEVEECKDGKMQFCNPYLGAESEACDGLDNDCDGHADETFGLGEPCEVGVGQCAGAGLTVCADDGEGVICLGAEAPPQAEVCDGLDNDCDGDTDEGLGVVACGLGVCAHTVASCVNGEPAACDPMAGSEVEICDGSDNDCDGEVDEDFMLDEPCVVGLGQCADEGVLVCAEDGNGVTCLAEEGVPQEEICDGLDNDCNGEVDDGLGVATCGVGLCEHTVEVCVDGVPGACDPLAGAEAEVCDGLDNDCDGEADDGLGVATCGIGLCEHTVEACVDGVPGACDPLEGAEEEACDGVDNDCDLDVDEGCGCEMVAIQIQENSGSPLAAYQMKLTLGADDINWSLVQESGVDIGFFDSEGNQIPHWFEKFDKGAEAATVWVRIGPLEAGGSASVHMFYGSVDVTYEQDPWNLFTFFDDFEDGDWTQRWSKSNNFVDVQESSGQLRLRPVPSGDYGVLVADTELSPAESGYAFAHRSRRVDSSCEGHGLYVFHDAGYNGPTYGHDGKGNDPQSGYRFFAGMSIHCSGITGLEASTSTGGGWTVLEQQALSNYNDDNWHRYEVTWDAPSSTFVFGLEGFGDTVSFLDAEWSGSLFSLGAHDEDSYSDFEWVLVRSYVAEEPSATLSVPVVLCD